MFSLIYCDAAMFAAIPDPPRDLRMVSRSWDSVLLAWTPGFDGGHPQNFTLTYAPQEGRVGVVGGGEGRVRGLYPATNYTFRLQASNRLGHSDWTAPVSVRTDGKL